MDAWNYRHRALLLHDLLEELEDPDNISEPPQGIILFPPDNANDDITDEDSGEENEMSINNLPGSQLRAEVDIIGGDGSDLEDDLPLSYIQRKKRSRLLDDIDIPGVEDGFESEDDLPLSHVRNPRDGPRRPIAKKKECYQWVKEDMTNSSSSWPTIMTVNNNLSPYQLFSCFFDNSVINMLVEYSNRYANQRNQYPMITANEIYCFLGILILSGYSTVPGRIMYWENADDSNNKLITSAMSRDRCSTLMKYIHCCDNTNLDPTDEFLKMRPLLNKINEMCLLHSPIEEFHSVDEAMVPYFGRHGCKQFIRGKPIRWGYKMWKGTTRLGYVIWMDPYQGKNNKLPPKYDIGLGSNVILQYTDVLDSSNYKLPYHLFIDNFFTSMPLMGELKKRGIRATGTVRENRIPLHPLVDSKRLKKEPRGTYDYSLAKDTGVLICKWNDNNVTCFATNSAFVFPLNNVKRFSNEEKQHVHVPQPNLVKLYNNNMGGVDRCDQNISLYRTSIRGKKWYFPVFIHCSEVAVQNAWQLHRTNRGTLDQLSFRRSLATNILESHKRNTERGPSKTSIHLHEHSRYDRLDHLIIYQENQTFCVFCHKKANFKCSKCNITLHPKYCFYSYHTPQ